MSFPLIKWVAGLSLAAAGVGVGSSFIPSSRLGRVVLLTAEDNIMTKLAEKVALVSGASRGIGKAIALALAKEGASLYLVAEETEGELQAVCTDCEDRHDAVVAHYGVMELSEVDAGERMVEACLSQFGRVDILVNNAGVRRRANFGEYTQDDYEFTQAVNIRTPFFASQAALPAMRQQGGGRIINITSQMGSVAFDGLGLYGLTKAALIYLTKAISYDCASDGIQANCVSPGPIATQYNIDRMKDDLEAWNKLEGGTTVGRFGKPEEVAEAVCFLATCETTFIQGHDLIIDGGWTSH
tara:strand:+ start:763 stop:1656 length:894 start_codon:yes stop_codon:yes gene_type:complete